MADDLMAKLQELNGKVDALTQSMGQIQGVLKDVLTVDKMNNQITVQSANYLCKAIGEMLGVSRYMLVSANVQNGVTVTRPEEVRRFNDLMGLIWPQSATGFPKVRLGDRGDGGYVLLQDFDSIETVYSLGICDNVSFDVDMVRHAPNVQAIWQYDDSVDRPPVENPKFRFTRKRINGVADLGQLAPNSLLKIDIEGSEWNFFMSCTDEDLNHFRQISCEFHDFSFFRDENWYARAWAVLEKLHRTHQSIHLHGNNIVPPVWTGDRFSPSVLEVTMARRMDYAFVPSQEGVPSQMDCPCSIHFPEVKVELSGTGLKPGPNVLPFSPSQSERFKIDL